MSDGDTVPGRRWLWSGRMIHTCSVPTSCQFEIYNQWDFASFVNFLFPMKDISLNLP